MDEPLDLAGLVVAADYTDGVKDEVLAEGHGGYPVSGHTWDTPGTRKVTVSYTVAGVTKTAAFEVHVSDAPVDAGQGLSGPRFRHLAPSQRVGA